jgi:hypothetical protein
MRDAELKGTRALPDAPDTTVDGAAIDLANSAEGTFLGDHDLLLSAPGAIGQTYSIIHSTAADLAGATVLYPGVIESGLSEDAATFRFRVPSTVKRYVGVRVVSGASVSDESAKSATLELLL